MIPQLELVQQWGEGVQLKPPARMEWFCKLNLFTILQKVWEGDHISPGKWQVAKLEEGNLSTKLCIRICGHLTYFYASDGYCGP